jgi:assimilatory nitrate reductase catalytic subunit
LRTETTAARPLRLNTGRIRDQWHTMTRTGESPRLGQHLPEPFVEVHPGDALKFGVADGDFARVTTDYGQCTLRVAVSERQQRGMLFAPIHWSEANATGARVGSLVAPYTDPFSGQPENKATPASIAPYEYVFRGFALSRKPLELPAHAWSARVAVNGGHGYLFADNADLAGWQSWLKSFARDDLAEYVDFGGGVYRAASFGGDRIDACLFIGPARDAGDWNVVKDLFAAVTLDNDQRRMLLSANRPMVSPMPARSCAPASASPQHDLRNHCGGRAFGRRYRCEAEGGHQLRFLHSGTEASDRADRSG